ncbi:MAG TPA: heavy-metal-associated domain-containing protein [Firmicutes bacterium]|nr:heavy-metal-associated domain-containing protein [Candidatus Fermentithermobacillaceae bacterium]
MNIKIKGMSCSHCEKRVADALKKVGATESVVSATSGSAKVTFDPDKTTVPMLEEAVKGAGYEVVEVKPA